LQYLLKGRWNQYYAREWLSATLDFSDFGFETVPESKQLPNRQLCRKVGQVCPKQFGIAENYRVGTTGSRLR
jgi:hypothetical protein